MNAVFSSSLGSLLDDVEGKVIQRIAVDLIDPDPDQPRREIPQSAIEERGNSLASEGQLQPIELIEKPDGRYILVFGEVRWRGAVWKGLPDLEAVVHPAGMDTKKIRRRQLIENLQRQDMTALDTANAIARLIKDEGSAAAAARAIGMSQAQISKYMAVLNLPPLAAKLAGSDATKDVETLATVAKIEREDPDAAEQLIVEAQTTGKLTRARAREVAQAVNEVLKTKRNTQALVEGGREAVKPAKSPSPKAQGDTAKPVKVKEGEALAITVKITENSRDAKRFARAKAEHGDATLYQAGISSSPDRCWVLFGDSPRAKKTDESPRLQEFPCNVIVLGMVTKYRPASDV